MRLLVGHLLHEVLAHLAIAFHALQRGTGQVVFFLVDSQFGLTHPFGDFVFIFFLLLLQQVLVRDGDRHLRLHLQKLVLHVEDDLLDHLLWLFRLVDQIVKVGPN